MERLWAHQAEAVAWASGRQAALLAYGVGTGKTRIACELAKGKRRVLVGCPLAVMPAWRKQCGMWLHEATVCLLDAAGVEKKSRQLAAAMAFTGPVVVVGNYESLWRVAGLVAVQWDMLIWDEIHRLKSPSGKASKWAANMCKLNPAAKRLGLSGTLIADKPLDAFGVWRAVESPGCPTFGQSAFHFKATYAITNPRVPGMVVGYRNMEQFKRKVAATTLHRRSEDVLDLPETMHEEISYTLNREEERVYSELEDEFCASLFDGRITPANVMVASGRMLQACGGFLPRDDDPRPRLISPDGSSKLARLAEWLADFSLIDPLVLFCRYVADMEGIRGVLENAGRSFSELSGRRRELADWQAGKTSTLIVQIQSGGTGVDLTRASYAIFYSLGHSLSEYVQALGRLHRPGQTRTTRFYSMIGRLRNETKTIEGRVYAALEAKQEVVDEVCAGYAARGAARQDHVA